MPTFDTAEIDESFAYPEQLYNTQDSCMTLEVLDELLSLRQPPLVYNFSRALQGPFLEMALRGFKVDLAERARAHSLLLERERWLRSYLDEIAHAVWDKGLNPQSPKQVLSFLTKALRLPELWTSKKGVRKLSSDRETLEKYDAYIYARPFVQAILAIRDAKKERERLEEPLRNGRYHTSFNIAATNTFRLSSDKAADGTGGNIQNPKRDDDIDHQLGDGSYELSVRKQFIADDGKILVSIDREQSESREVGFMLGKLFDDWSYLDATESGDLHTLVCRYNWANELDWTDDPKANRKLADQLFYRNYSYRDMAKKLGHGCLTADHEVLTPNGWVSIAEKPEQILQWGTHKSEFVTVSNWTDKDYRGEMVELTSNSLSLFATADHRVLFTRDGLRGLLDNNVHEAPAKDIPPRVGIPLGYGFVGGTEPMTPEIARMIAAYQCDGSFSSKRAIRFHMKKERKFSRLEHLADKAALRYKRKGNNAVIQGKWVGLWPKDAGVYLLSWPKEALHAYINEHKHWDGHIAKTYVSLSSVKREHLEWIQTIGRLIGVGGNFQKTHTSGFGSTVHVLQQNKRRFTYSNKLQRKHSWWEGKVYCPTVPSGAFYVRRNGKISVTGNSNYMGQPYTMARHSKCPIKMVERFQARYFAQFPGIPKWHRWVAEQIQTKGFLKNLFDVERQFFGRPSDDDTLRKAIAFGPQSSTAFRTNLGLLRIWYEMRDVELLVQRHDSVVFQCDYDSKLGERIQRALDLTEVWLTHNGRRFSVPGDVKVGFNDGKFHEKLNPNGLSKWKGSETRIRIPEGDLRAEILL